MTATETTKANLPTLLKKEENRKKKAWLNSYQGLLKRTQIIEEQIKELRRTKEDLGTSKGNMKYTGHQKEMENYICQMERLEKELIEEKINSMNRCSKILRKIDKMENEDEKNILILKYITGKTLEEAGKEIGYSWTQAKRIHGNALGSFNRVKE